MQRRLRVRQRWAHMSRWPSAASIIIAVEVFVVAFLSVAGGRATTVEPPIPRGAHLASRKENGRNEQYVLRVLKGKAPAGGVVVFGVVISDTSCQRDSHGFSHCHNGIDLANGSRITVVNTHRMMRYPCLRPGEKLSLDRINSSWVLARVH